VRWVSVQGDKGVGVDESIWVAEFVAGELDDGLEFDGCDGF
jgi:hypothetical protein